MMNTCSTYPCMRTTSGCPICDPTPDMLRPYQGTPYINLQPSPSPRTMPVNIPFSHIGITVVTLDGYGNISIKVDQPHPSSQ